jgi:hypothetical protein
MTGEPPLLETVAPTVMVPLPGVSVTDGAEGTDAGATSTGVEADESPSALTARISMGYAVPFEIAVVPLVESAVIVIRFVFDEAVDQVAPASVEYW